MDEDHALFWCSGLFVRVETFGAVGESIDGTHDVGIFEFYWFKERHQRLLGLR